MHKLTMAALFAALTAGTAWSQRLTGEIRLEVRDASNAPMTASGSLESLAAGIHRTFQTDAEGRHTLSALPFGLYSLTVQHEGFASQSLLVDVRSETPLPETVLLSVAPLQSSVVVQESATLLDTASTGAAQHLGPDTLEDRKSSSPGRSVIDQVNMQPGWLLEANGILHPRGSEYDVQYVIDGIPIYDNRSPAFAQSLGIDDFEDMTVRTANYPAEFGRKLGGVIEVNTERDARAGWHGRTSLQGGSFDQLSAFASLQYSRSKNSFSVSGEGMQTDRYLDPPVLDNFTNHGSGGGVSARFDRDWSPADTTRFYADTHHTGFLVPNELLQEMAGQRQDRTANETLGQVSHTHLFTPHVILQTRAMVRDTSAMLWSNALSTPILPSQDRGFRESYVGGSVSWSKGSNEIKAGGDALFSSIHENFAYRIINRQINGVPIFDSDIPLNFNFNGTGAGRDQSAFLQDMWHRGNLTLNAGVRFDHYKLIADETAWSPRLGAAYAFRKAGLVLRASYDRVFQVPAIENILLASTDLAEQLGGGVSLPLKPARGNFVEAGFSKSIFSKLRLDATWYRRRLENFADDSLLLNTGVSFPIAFKSGEVHGYEVKLEMPRWGRFSGSVSYSNMLAVGQLPIAGGLLLGDDAAGAVSGSGAFPITQDQRNTFRSRVRVQVHRRAWIAFGGSYNSGLPFEIEGPADLTFIAQQYGSAILSKVNFDRGRLRPSASLDASAGLELYKTDRAHLRLQGDVFNLGDRLNVIDFSGILSGTAIDAGRNFAIRLNAGF